VNFENRINLMTGYKKMGIAIRPHLTEKMSAVFDFGN
jgi:hypothetical protein